MSSMTLSAMTTIPGTPSDLLNDAKLDYYGKQLAAGSDRCIKIFDVLDDGQRHQTAELTGHEGPVWQLAWAHPEFGNVLASCSYDRQVFVWKEHAPQHWVLVHKYIGHEGSVNAIAWGPREAGLRLASASSDESVSVLTHHGGGQWSTAMFTAHKTGCNAVSWAPYDAAGVDATTGCGLRLVSGGCDNLVRLWVCNGEDNWSEQMVLPALHTDWVRDVAFAPTIGATGGATLASCAQDRKVAVWSEGGGGWTSRVIELPEVVWSVSWSITGGILAVATGDNQVTLWKENATGDWAQIGQLSEKSQPAPAS